MARGRRPSGRFFIYSALTSLAVILAVDKFKGQAGVVAVPAGRGTSRRVP